MDAKWEVKNGRVLANDFGSPRKTKKLDPDAPLDETVADPAASAGPPAVYMPVPDLYSMQHRREFWLPDEGAPVHRPSPKNKLTILIEYHVGVGEEPLPGGATSNRYDEQASGLYTKALGEVEAKMKEFFFAENCEVVGNPMPDPTTHMPEPGNAGYYTHCGTGQSLKFPRHGAFEVMAVFGSKTKVVHSKITSSEFPKPDSLAASICLLFNIIESEAMALQACLLWGVKMDDKIFSPTIVGHEGKMTKREGDLSFNYMKENTKLREVELKSCGLDDGTASTIAEGLKCHEGVTKLLLEGNDIGDAGAKALGSALTVNHSLTELSLKNNKITAAGATEFASCIGTHTNLNLLDLTENPIDLPVDADAWPALALPEPVDVDKTELELAEEAAQKEIVSRREDIEARKAVLAQTQYDDKLAQMRIDLEEGDAEVIRLKERRVELNIRSPIETSLDEIKLVNRPSLEPKEEEEKVRLDADEAKATAKADAARKFVQEHDDREAAKAKGDAAEREKTEAADAEAAAKKDAEDAAAQATTDEAAAAEATRTENAVAAKKENARVYVQLGQAVALRPDPPAPAPKPEAGAAPEPDTRSDEQKAIDADGPDVITFFSPKDAPMVVSLGGGFYKDGSGKVSDSPVFEHDDGLCFTLDAGKALRVEKVPEGTWVVCSSVPDPKIDGDFGKCTVNMPFEFDLDTDTAKGGMTSWGGSKMEAAVAMAEDVAMATSLLQLETPPIRAPPPLPPKPIKVLIGKGYMTKECLFFEQADDADCAFIADLLQDGLCVDKKAFGTVNLVETPWPCTAASCVGMAGACLLADALAKRPDTHLISYLSQEKVPEPPKPKKAADGDDAGAVDELEERKKQALIDEAKAAAGMGGADGAAAGGASGADAAVDPATLPPIFETLCKTINTTGGAISYANPDSTLKGIHDFGAVILAEMIKKNAAKVTELSLTRQYLSDNGIVPLVAALKGSACSKLCLDGNAVGDAAAFAVAEHVKDSASGAALSVVSLAKSKRGAGISVLGAGALSVALKESATLQVLNLKNHTGIKDDGIYRLANGIGPNSTMQELDLTNVGMTDDGLKALCEALKTNTTLASLILDANSFTPEPASLMLIGMLKANTGLKKLSVKGKFADSDPMGDVREVWGGKATKLEGEEEETAGIERAIEGLFPLVEAESK